MSNSPKPKALAPSPNARAVPLSGPSIVGRAVPPLLPLTGPVYVFIVGEAPGPRGADKSGIPFFGDAAGKHLYGLLSEIHAVELPVRVSQLEWDGHLFAEHALQPRARGVALGNAYDRCPTNDGIKFRAPTRTELEGQANIARLVKELRGLSERGLRGVVTLGRVAAKTVDAALAHTPMPTLVRRSLPHPSAQGLLSMAPDRGRGARMVDLQVEWQTRLRDAIIDAGFEAAPVNAT